MLKIIQIVENLDKGAVENWLVRTFLKSREFKPDWEWTFYCILGRPGRLDESVMKAGGRIVYSKVTISDKIPFLRQLRQELKHGNYDILHAHHDYLSGFYLLASNGIRFKRRLLQIHNTDKALPVGNKFLHDLLLWPFRRLAYHYSDLIVGISEDTLLEFMHGRQSKRPETTILYYGVDLSPFENGEMSDPSFFLSIGIPENAKTLLFVGRMNPWKNPLFVVEILAELSKKRKNVYAIFVGQGDLEKEILKKADSYGLTGNVRNLGWSDNTAMLMKNASVFVFPRLEYPKEGLGLVVVEAQAAGLPMAISNAIVKDAIVVDELANYISLKDNPAEWASAIEKLLDFPPQISRKEALARLRNSPFEMSRATQNLLRLYEGDEEAKESTTHNR